MINKLDFLLGNWKMIYHIPKSSFGEASTSSGTGSFKRALKDKYLFFEYNSSSASATDEAHAIFAWDEKVNLYRLWWFENSGNFSNATGKFINDETLFLNWHDSLLVQTFRRISPDKVELKMENPDANGKYALIMEVIFTRKQI